MNDDLLQPFPSPEFTGPQTFQINTPDGSFFGSSVCFGNTCLTTLWGEGTQVQINQRQIGQFQMIDIY